MIIVTKKKVYRYIGKNGFVTTPVILLGVEGIPMYVLSADIGKILTDGNSFLKTVKVFEEELSAWTEIDWVEENS